MVVPRYLNRRTRGHEFEPQPGTAPDVNADRRDDSTRGALLDEALAASMPADARRTPGVYGDAAKPLIGPECVNFS